MKPLPKIPKEIKTLMDDWVKLAQQNKNTEDVWVTFDALPQYCFRNPQIISISPELEVDSNVFEVNFKLEFENIQKNF